MEISLPHENVHYILWLQYTPKINFIIIVIIIIENVFLQFENYTSSFIVIVTNNIVFQFYLTFKWDPFSLFHPNLFLNDIIVGDGTPYARFFLFNIVFLKNKLKHRVKNKTTFSIV